MLDKSIPFYGVLMIKHDTDSYPCYALPEGYKFLGYRNGLEMEWARIEYELGQIDTFEKALEVFRREFPGTEEHLSKHCFFIESPSGDIAAIASLWHGDSFGEDYPRVHWVAVDEKYQGKGLAKALLTKLMDVYHEHGHTLPLYLVTQTWSYKAINLYEHFGFEPYLGEKLPHWKKDDYDEMNPKAWALIHEKIASRGK